MLKVLKEAWRNVKLEGFEVSEATIYLEDIEEEETGLLVKVGKKESFVNWNQQKKAILESIHRKEPVPENEVLILLDAYTDLSSAQVKSLLGKELDEEAEKALEAIGALAHKGVYEVLSTSEEEFEIEKEVECFSSEGAMEGPEEKTATEPEQVNEEPKKEKEKEKSAKSVTPPKKEGKKEVVEETEEGKQDVEQISLLPQEELQKVTKPKQTKKKAGGGVGFSSELEELMIQYFKDKTEDVVEEEDTRTREEMKVARADIFALEEKRQKLDEFDLSHDFKQKVVAFAKKQAETLTPEQMDYVPTLLDYQGETAPLKKGIGSLLTGNNLILQGGAGVGKTTLLKTIGALLNYPMYVANGSEDANIETFVSYKELQKGNIVVRDASCLKAMKNGGLFMIDECNAVMASVMITMHNAMDDEREIYDENSGQMVKARENFRFVGSMNPSYAGTQEMNTATLDRCLAIRLKPMTTEQMVELLENYDRNYSGFQKDVLDMKDVSKKDLSIVVEIAQILRNAVNDGRLTEPGVDSLRNIIAILKASRMLDMKEAVEMVADKYSDDTRLAILSILKEIEVLDITPEDIAA